MNSVGKAYAVLRGRMTGDQEEAQKFLDNLSPFQRAMRNRIESRRRGPVTKRYKVGSK